MREGREQGTEQEAVGIMAEALGSPLISGNTVLFCPPYTSPKTRRGRDLVFHLVLQGRPWPSTFSLPP